jgi:hypothetical protein
MMLLRERKTDDLSKLYEQFNDGRVTFNTNLQIYSREATKVSVLLPHPIGRRPPPQTASIKPSSFQQFFQPLWSPPMNVPSKPTRDEHAADADHMLDEADIGSGERTPAQLETDEEIRSIPPLPHDSERGKPEQPPRAK